MLPGITPFLGGFPAMTGFMSPATADWVGSFPSYSTSQAAVVTGGVAPLTYAWVAPASGVTISSGQGTPTVTLASASGPYVATTCTITDAVGQTLILEGQVNAVVGGGG